MQWQPSGVARVTIREEYMWKTLNGLAGRSPVPDEIKLPEERPVMQPWVWHVLDRHPDKEELLLLLPHNVEKLLTLPSSEASRSAIIKRGSHAVAGFFNLVLPWLVYTDPIFSAFVGFLSMFAKNKDDVSGVYVKRRTN